jgi:hypothetical protein
MIRLDLFRIQSSASGSQVYATENVHLEQQTGVAMST